MELKTYLMSHSNNLLLAIVCALGIIVMSIPPNFTLRNWVFISAFEGMSISQKTKIMKSHTLLQRILLWYTIAYNNSPKTKRRVICYLVWWCISILLAIMFFLPEFSTAFGVIMRFLYIPKLIFDVIISVIGLNWIEYKEKETRK
jgi:hypothetical protein